MAITIVERPYGFDWCKMPMPMVLNSDRKFLQSATTAVWTIKVEGLTIAVGKYIKITYSDVEVIFDTTASAGTDVGTDLYVDAGNAADSDVYFQRNYFINRDFTVSSAVILGDTYFQFTAKFPGEYYNAAVVSDDTNISFISGTVGQDATPNPNFAYLIDVYLQKVNSDDINDVPFTKLPTMVLAPNTEESEIDIAELIWPYTTPHAPIPFPGVGFTEPEYMHSHALRYRVIYTEFYGTNPVPQIADELISFIPFIDCNIALRGGVRKDIYDYIYSIGNGTASAWITDRLWLTSLNGGTWRRVSARQYNWLSILADGSIHDAIVKIKYFNSPSGGTEYDLFTLSWPSGRTSDDVLPLRIPVGLPTALPIHAPSFAFNKYEIRIVDGNDDTELYAPVTFYVEPEHALERTLIFENGLGGWESWRFIGQKTHNAIITGDTYDKLNALFNNIKHSPEIGNHNTQLQEEMELNSGPLANLDEVYLLVELLLSDCIYYHNFFDEHKDYFRVVRVPDTFLLHQDDNNHYYISLKVRKAWKDTTHGFLPVL